MSFLFVIVFRPLFWFCPLTWLTSPAASRLPVALQYDFFLLPPQKSNHAKHVSVS